MINAESGQPSDPVQASLDELAVDSVMAERVEEERAEQSGAAADESIGRQATAGVFWLTAQRWAIRLLGFVTIAVLTRLLSPEDFGTVAAASTVLPFFFLIADLGFAAYIVQVKDADRRMLSTAFWFSLIAGVLLCAVMVAIAPLLGVVFHDERVTPVLQSLSLWVVLTAFGSVPMALLRRRMQFRILALQGAVAAVIAQVVAMAVAFAGLGVWALVAQSLVAPAVTTLLAWITSRWRPAMLFSWREFRVMAGFGGQVLGVEFIAMLRAWGEAAVISGTLGIAALGYMSIAQRLVQVVQDLTGSAIVPVTTVAFAKIREARDRLRDAYLRAVRMTYAVLSLPLTVIAVTAPLVVPIVFGDGWEQSYTVARILALGGVLTVGAALDHGLFYGLGKPGTWFVYALVIDGLTLGTTFFLASQGLVAIAWGFLGVCIVATVSRWFLTGRLLETSAWTVAGPFGYLAVAVILSGGAGWLTLTLTATWPAVLSIILVGAVVSVLHLAVTRLMAPDVLTEGFAMLARSKVGARLPFVRGARERAASREVNT
ncbi:MAG: lipopolysaccharide biosynthesis protein [Microbacterium sp. SCN 70-27]|uniref:lipopolysaccharide biosynthesis protein n=1 Tax=unclassified Microbacterium TaxID=2609290 RepID=UPI00086C3AFF|nr:MULTISPECIES: lipopolysaccharide biosynthesis protein [unclassified Microbacterium]ODT28392.1 MAG: lipopolysaccharide biosynthesis protein [Microbacterium sp. SCN 70-27]